MQARGAFPNLPGYCILVEWLLSITPRLRLLHTKLAIFHKWGRSSSRPKWERIHMNYTSSVHLRENIWYSLSANLLLAYNRNYSRKQWSDAELDLYTSWCIDFNWFCIRLVLSVYVTYVLFYTVVGNCDRICKKGPHPTKIKNRVSHTPL